MKPESLAEEAESSSSSKVMKPARRKSHSSSVDSRRSSTDVRPASRRSSVEAENRLDPGTDDPEDKPVEQVNHKVMSVDKENVTKSEDATSDTEVTPNPARRKRL